MQKRLGLVIDQERCIGCEACTVACKLENKGVKGWIGVTTQNAAYKDTPAGVFPNLKMHFLPTLCNHCEHPPCVEACPLEAITKNEDGIVILDDKSCDGCQTCLDACPYGAITFNDKKEKAEKCNLCVHRIDQGLEPFCVICCEGQALHFGDLDDADSPVSKILAGKDTFQLKTEAGTGPSVYYCPPRAPRGL